MMEVIDLFTSRYFPLLSVLLANRKYFGKSKKHREVQIGFKTNVSTTPGDVIFFAEKDYIKESFHCGSELRVGKASQLEIPKHSTVKNIPLILD